MPHFSNQNIFQKKEEEIRKQWSKLILTRNGWDTITLLVHIENVAVSIDYLAWKVVSKIAKE